MACRRGLAVRAQASDRRCSWARCKGQQSTGGVFCLSDDCSGGVLGSDKSVAIFPVGGEASMPIPVLMPALSPTMEKGNLAKWLKAEGDQIRAGDVIAEIETDKATMEVEAVDEGTLGKILVPEGTADVAVNTPIAVILGEGEDKAAIKDGGGAAPRKADNPAPQQAPEPAAKPARPPAEPKTAAPKQPEVMAEPDVPPGTEMVTMTMREALRDAMA